MKKTHTPSFNRWFESKNRKHIAFTSSVVLIGILFVVAVVSILVKKGPSADSVNDSVGRLAKRVTLGNGQLSYILNGTTKTEPSNSVVVRIKLTPTVMYTLQGLGKANQVTGLPVPSITVKRVTGQDVVADPLAATATAGITPTQVQSAFDSDPYRDKVNGTTADLKIKLKVPNYLSRTVTVSDPKAVVVTTPLLAGNFADSGASADIIDEADASVCGPAFKLPVTAANKACDLNYDGAIDEADSSIWGPNFMQRGSTQ